MSGKAIASQLKKKKAKTTAPPIKDLLPPAPAAAEADGKAPAAAAEAPKHIIPEGDVNKVRGQKYLVLSYVTPDGSTKVRSLQGLLFKFSGCFPDQASAERQMELIRNEDPRFDVTVVEMYIWGQVPLPDNEKPFVPRRYANEMLTRVVSGLQNSMAQGKKEMDERRTRDRAKAEAAMRKLKGKDYKMPEKSEITVQHEERIRKEREAEAAAAASENRSHMTFYSLHSIEQALLAYCDANADKPVGRAVADGIREVLTTKFSVHRERNTDADVADSVMRYCVDNLGKPIDVTTGTGIMKFLAENSVEREARLRLAEERERPDEDPSKLPSREEVIKQHEEFEKQKQQQQQQEGTGESK